MSIPPLEIKLPTGQKNKMGHPVQQEDPSMIWGRRRWRILEERTRDYPHRLPPSFRRTTAWNGAHGGSTRSRQAAPRAHREPGSGHRSPGCYHPVRYNIRYLQKLVNPIPTKEAPRHQPRFARRSYTKKDRTQGKEPRVLCRPVRPSSPWEFSPKTP